MDIDVSLVRALIASQFAGWAHLPVERVEPNAERRSAGGIMRMTYMLLTTALTTVLPGEGHAQEVRGWGLGVTWSNMVTSSSSGSISGDTMRRFPSIWVSGGLAEGGAVDVDTGVRFVAKGFDVTGPTIHAEYLEAPLLITSRPAGSGLQLSVGAIVGLRIHCTRSARTATGTISDRCGQSRPPLDWGSVRRWDVGLELDFGWRFARTTSRPFSFGAGFARSISDVLAETGRTRNEVLRIWVEFERRR